MVYKKWNNNKKFALQKGMVRYMHLRTMSSVQVMNCWTISLINIGFVAIIASVTHFRYFLKQNKRICFQRNELENNVCKIADILSRHLCDNPWYHLSHVECNHLNSINVLEFISSKECFRQLSYKNMTLKTSSPKWRTFCLSQDVLREFGKITGDGSSFYIFWLFEPI